MTKTGYGTGCSLNNFNMKKLFTTNQNHLTIITDKQKKINLNLEPNA